MASVRTEVLLERGRERFWLLPGAAVVVGLMAGVALPAAQRSWGGWDSALVFGGGPDGARAVLSTIAGSTMTVTSLTFSLTMVTLQLASSQFSPRLLRTFLRDLRNQSVLAILLASFTFSLVVLLSVRSADEGKAFAPGVAVTLALVLALTSVLALVWFIAHVVEVSRVEKTMEDIAEAARRTASGLRRDVVPAVVADDAASGTPVRSDCSGFVQSVDEDRLLVWAREHGARVDVVVPVGAWVVHGQPVLRVQGDGTGDTGTGLRDCVAVGAERTAAQDVTFGVGQLVDIALRALSPGINDPTTATTAVGHLASVLVAAARAPLGDYGLRDAGQVRLRVARPSFDDVVDEMFGPVRRCGAEQPAVLAALVQAAGVVGEQLDDPEQRAALLRHVGEVEVAVEAADLTRAEQVAQRALVARARSLLTGQRL